MRISTAKQKELLYTFYGCFNSLYSKFTLNFADDIAECINEIVDCIELPIEIEHYIGILANSFWIIETLHDKFFREKNMRKGWKERGGGDIYGVCMKNCS